MSNSGVIKGKIVSLSVSSSLQFLFIYTDTTFEEEMNNGTSQE